MTHIAGAAQYRRQAGHQPQEYHAGVQRVGICHRRAQRRPFAAQQCIDGSSQADNDGGAHQSEDADDDHRVQGEGVGLVLVAGAQRARHRRGDAAADAAGGHHHHQHYQRKDQGGAGQGVHAQQADVVTFQKIGQCLGQHHHQVGGRQRQQGGQHRRLQNHPGARIRQGARRAQGGGLVHGGHRCMINRVEVALA